MVRDVCVYNKYRARLLQWLGRWAAAALGLLDAAAVRSELAAVARLGGGLRAV